MTQKIQTYWYWILIIAILLMEAAVFLLFGENSYIGIHDNLDIHITDYQILKQQDAFFSQDSTIPILGGISRDFLLSELSLYSFLYMIFPTFTAYILGYFLKIGIALYSGILLGRDILGTSYFEHQWLVVLVSFIYGLLPLYPAFSFSFASIPLFVYLVRCIQRNKGKRYYLFIFLYPLLSYFTFFGLFLIGYTALYTLYICLKKKTFFKPLALATLLLALGYVAAEYRLFRLIFFSGEPTIRDTMANTWLGFEGILRETILVFTNSIFHAEDLRRYFLLPVVLIYFIWLNLGYIRKRSWKALKKDPFNFILLTIALNSVVYGFYYWKGFHTLVVALLPPLKGWQFNRTVFFNPFLFCLAFAIVVYRLAKHNHKKWAAAACLCALLVPLGKQSLYNDFYNTVYTHAYQLIKQKESESLSYKEFFSEDLFASIKESIGYQGEYSVAYGFHPAVLSYNNISTLDACLSHYYQSYKEDFREIIAPALEKSEAARIYYDGWGGRAYIFSGTDESVWAPAKTMQVTDYELSINSDAFRRMGGVYIFSRIPINNADSLNLASCGEFSSASSPYTIWVYKADRQ